MACWKAPGSILEAPDSILEAPGLDLGGFWDEFFEIFAQNAKKAKNAKNAQSSKILPLNALSQRWGGGGVPPQGVFNGIGAKLAILATRFLCKDFLGVFKFKMSAAQSRLKNFTKA